MDVYVDSHIMHQPGTAIFVDLTLTRDLRIGADLVYSFAAVDPFMAAITALLQEVNVS